MENKYLWEVVLIDNFDCYDSNHYNSDLRSIIFTEEEEAKKCFKNYVKLYIKNQIETIEETFDLDFSSLQDIVDEINYLNKYKKTIKAGECELSDFDYKFGIKVNECKNYVIFAINKKEKSVDIFHREKIMTERYNVYLQQIEIGKESYYEDAKLDNVEEIESILESL